MRHRLWKYWLDRVCLLPCVALLAGALVGDDWQTHTGIGKAIWFYATMAFVPPVAGLSFWNNRQPVRFHIVDLLVAIWLSIVFAQACFSSEAVNGNSLATIGLLGVLYACFRILLVQHPSGLRWLMFVAMAVSCAEAVWGLLQLYGFARSQHALYPTTGSFFNPGPYAGYLATLLPVALFYVLPKNRIPERTDRRGPLLSKLGPAVPLATVAATLLILPATMSRAGWMAAAMGSAVIVLGHYHRSDRGKNKSPRTARWKMGWAAAVLAIAAWTLFGLYGIKKDSADGRALIWKISAEMAWRSPAGMGSGNFAGSYGAAQEAYFASGRGSEREAQLAGEPQYAFNEFVQIGVEQGMPALLLFLLMVASACAGGIRNGQPMAVGGLVALLTFAFFSYPFRLMPFLVLLAFFVAGCVSVPRGSARQRDFMHFRFLGARLRVVWNPVAILLLSIGYVAGVLYARYPTFKAHRAWDQGRAYYRSGMYERVVENYGPIADRMKDQPPFLFEYGRSLYRLGRYAESIAVLQQGRAASADPMFPLLIGRCQQAVKDFKKAERSYRDAADRVPNRLYPFYLLAKMYDEMGEGQKACEMAMKVVRKEVKVHSPAVEEMKAEMKKRIREGCVHDLDQKE